MAAADYRLMTEATGQRIAAALENLAGFGDYLTTSDVVNNLTRQDTDKPAAQKEAYDLNVAINKFPQLVTSSTITANGGTLSILSNNSTSIYIVAIGGWNYSQLFSVMPANGGEPKSVILASFSNRTTDYTFSANGQWGFTITNNTEYQTNCSIYEIKKNI